MSLSRQFWQSSFGEVLHILFIQFGHNDKESPPRKFDLSVVLIHFLANQHLKFQSWRFPGQSSQDRRSCTLKNVTSP